MHYFKLKSNLRAKPHIFDFESINAGCLESLKLLKHLVFNIFQNVVLPVHRKQLFLTNNFVLMNPSFPMKKTFLQNSYLGAIVNIKLTKLKLTKLTLTFKKFLFLYMHLKFTL